MVLAAADPANPVRRCAAVAGDGRAHRPGRKAGALVALVDGELAWFLERGGRSLLSFTDDGEAHMRRPRRWPTSSAAGRVQSLLVEKINGVPVLEPDAEGERAAVLAALTGAGFSRTPRGLRLR